MKWWKIAGWVLSALLGLIFFASGAFKLSGSEDVAKQFATIGLKDKVLLIAIGELVSALLFLMPKTQTLGVLLLSAYMGGAIMTHMSHGESYVAQSVILVLIWVAGFLRRPSLMIDPVKPIARVDLIS